MFGGAGGAEELQVYELQGMKGVVNSFLARDV